MEALDLRRHAPSEYAGKVVTVNGCTYKIGPHIATGSKYIVHPLINQRSGLNLHVIKVRKTFFADPNAARAESLATAEGMAGLRHHLLLSYDPKPCIPFVIVVEGHSGTFEVHESVDQRFHAASFPANDMGLAKACIETGDAAEERAACEEVLARESCHTLALNNLAFALGRLGDAHRAYDALKRAVEIEPNYPMYLANRANMAMHAGYPWLATQHFIELQQRFPGLHDYDERGIEIFLHQGRPDLALQLVERAPVDDARREELDGRVTSAVEAKADAVRLMQKAEHHLVREKNAAKCLESMAGAYSRYPNDFAIAMNYAFALRRVGDFARAVELLLAQVWKGGLLYCTANAAFCCIELADWQRAMFLLEGTQRVLFRNGKAPSPFDLPGVTEWYAEAGIREEQPLSASRLIDRAMANCSDRRLVTPEIEALARSYRDAVGVYARKTARASWWARLTRRRGGSREA